MASLMMRFLMFLFVFVLCFMERSYASEDRKLVNSNGRHFHTVEIGSLLPRDVCNSSTIKGSKKRLSRMEVFHKHGPCSHQQYSSSKATTTTPSLSQVLSQDESRVKWIQAQLNPDSNTNMNTNTNTVNITDSKQRNQGTVIDTRHGSGSYIVAVGLGTPRRTMSLEFDTISSLTWTQCKPCLGSCYDQRDPIFDPSGSTSYAKLSCASAECSKVQANTGLGPSCDYGTCFYDMQYGEWLFTVGDLSRDKLAISASDVIPNFVFGCGQDNQFIGNDAGVLGLGRSSLSIVQTTQKYGKYFSYCLPSTPSSTGYLAFGKTQDPTRAKFTPLKGTRFYAFDIVAIFVEGCRLPIKLSVFKTAGSIIDTGTVITRLPPAAYNAMRAAFDEIMSTKYQKAEPFSILDTCYEVPGYDTTIIVPKVSFVFGGNVRVDLDPSGTIVFVRENTQVCLAFAGNRDARDVAIYGSVQQRTFDVVYDVAGGKIGFAPCGCN